jgi:hypothetical protein
MHAVPLKRLELLNQVGSGTIEILKNRFQPFRRNGLDPHQSAANPGPFHGIEELRILGGFHGDLGEECQIIGKSGQALHQFKSLLAHGLQTGEFFLVALAFRELEIGESDGIKVVIRQGNKTESEPAQLNHFMNDDIGGSLPRPLTIRSPDRTEGTMLGTAPNRLHGGPHVAILGQQIPSRGGKILGLNPAALINLAGRLVQAIFQRFNPDEIAIAFDDRVCSAKFQSLAGIKRGVNAAENDERATGAGDPADFVTPKGVPRMDSNSHDITGLDSLRIQAIEGLVANLGIPKRGGRRRRKDV